MDAGRLGLGGRAAQRAAARPLLRRAGGCAAVREIRSGSGVRADGEDAGAQRLHPADRAAHAADGADIRRALPARAAHGRLRRRSRSVRETYEWGRSELGLTINEFYGQTECNLVLCVLRRDRRFKAAAPSASRLPGHAVAIIDAEGRRASPARPGRSRCKRPDPVMFLDYWEKPDATRENSSATG